MNFWRTPDVVVVITSKSYVMTGRPAFQVSYRRNLVTAIKFITKFA